MIPYKPTSYRELSGDFEAVISSITSEKNQWYKPEFGNSCENVLTIDFVFTDPEGGDDIEFSQRFVNPLTGGNGLFQQLLDALEFIPDQEGGEFDEQDFVGLKLTVTMGKRKGKNDKEYDTVASVVKRGGAPKKGVKKEETEEVFSE